MTVVGRGNLIKLFPNFKDDVAENGIDLRVGKLQRIVQNSDKLIGCVDDEKLAPDYEDVEPTLINEKPMYILEPMTNYFVTIDREIYIPDGYTQTYDLRSTFARCDLQLSKAVGDNGFRGTLMMGLTNSNPVNKIAIGLNERIIQAITYTNDGTASNYGGSYQEDKFYKE